MPPLATGAEIGRYGERVAAAFVRRNGYRVLTRNFTSERGEIDLVCRDGDTLVFVEVKTRRQGQPAEAVTPEKQERLTLAALHFLKRHRLLEGRSRFDVVAIVWPDQNESPLIEHIRNAFEATGRGQFFR
jgi:putative endonuclease